VEECRATVDRSQFAYYKTGKVSHRAGGIDCCNAAILRFSPNDLKFASITILKQALGAQGDGIRPTELARSTLQNLCSIVD
jgi:hypothetical protein